MICFIIGSCCMSVYWYRQRRRQQQQCDTSSKVRNLNLMNLTDGSSDSGHDVPISSSDSGNGCGGGGGGANGNGSTSPSSMTSSELVVDSFSSEENLKINKYKTMNIYDNYENRLIISPYHNNNNNNIQKNQIKLHQTISNNNHKRVKNSHLIIGEVEREALILQNEIVNQKSLNNCSDQLLVQVTTPIINKNKKMVASTESLTSYNSNKSLTVKTPKIIGIC